ncbi:MAG: YHS domain-containing protein [Candidatus Pacearchaeota archaeon]|nr:YHS domain-containing protein [Candidatus Pacearchaeota archaeon]
MKRDHKEEIYKDPVCGMEVSRISAIAETSYQGRTYYFCADVCKETFDAEPEKYISHNPSRKKMP